MTDSSRRYVKAFLIGSCYAVMVIPMMQFGFAHQLHPIDVHHPPPGVMRPLVIENMPIVLPFYFGLWNVVSLWVAARLGVGASKLRYFLSGGIFGSSVALYGLVVHSIPTTLFGLPESRQYAVLVIGFMLYGLIWRFIVRTLNLFFEIDKVDAPSPAAAPVMGRWVGMQLLAVSVVVGVPLVSMVLYHTVR
jgi:hypothetical protein